MTSSSYVSISTFELAAASAGFSITNRRRNRFNISSAACHGGDSSTICWVTEDEPGKVVAHCHKCGFPDSDRNIRASLGLHVFQDYPERSTLTKAELRPSITETWIYYTRTGKEALHKVFRHDLSCSRKDCRDRGPHKHSIIVRDPSLKGTPLEEGYEVHFHSPTERAPDHVYVICEGQKTAESVKITGHTGVSYIQGSGYASKADYRKLKDEMEVVVAPDNDQAGIKAALESARELLLVGVVGVTVLDVAQFPSNGGDLADLSELDRVVVLQERIGKRYTEVSEVRADLAMHVFNMRCANMPNSRMPLMDVYDSHVLHEQVEDVWDGIIRQLVDKRRENGQPPEVYEQHSQIVELTNVNGIMKTEQVNQNKAKTFVSRGVYWHKDWDTRELFALESENITATDWDVIASSIEMIIPVAHGKLVYEPFRAEMEKEKQRPHIWKLVEPKPNYPNGVIAQSVVSKRDFRLPHLAGVINRPMIDAKSEHIMVRSGYYSREAVYLSWNSDLEPLPLDKSLKVLETVFGEFPFDTAASKANFYGCLLSGFIGLACPVKPLFLFNKATPRTGATLLAELVSVLISEAEPVNAGPLNARDDENNGKAISSASYKSAGVVLFDNMAGQIDSSALASYCTSGVYTARKLGSNTDHLEIDRKPLVDIATSNNPSLTLEILKRVVNIRIDPQMEDPSKRQFTIKNIKQYVYDNRDTIISAVLGMVKHWMDAGKPMAEPISEMGGFDIWRDMTNSILKCCGIDGFLENVQQAVEVLASDEVSDEKELIRFWLNMRGYQVTNAGELAALGAVGDEDAPDEDIIHLGGGKKFSRQTKLGNFMRALVDKVYEFEDNAKVVVRRSKVKTRNKVHYQLEKFAVPEDFTEECSMECGPDIDQTGFYHVGNCPYA